jgi:hypothetical protein
MDVETETAGINPKREETSAGLSWLKTTMYMKMGYVDV